MAAAITLNSTTAEGQLLELMRELHELEQAIPAATRPNRVGITFDVEDKTVSLAANLEIAQSGTGNEVSFAAVPYL